MTHTTSNRLTRDGVATGASRCEGDRPPAEPGNRPTQPRAPTGSGPRRWLESALEGVRRSSSRGAGLTTLALVVGAGAGLGAVAFRYMILGFTYLFTGHRDYSAAGHAPNPLISGVGIWFVVAAPVIGGLLYGPLVSRFAPEARGHGVPEVMYAVNRLGGRMRPQVPVVKSLASAVCIGAGGSVGREGPIVQIGSALGSITGQLMRLSEEHLRLLVACGAAGGISATFNAPIAGVFFALELILRDFQTRSFGLVVLSSVTADAVGQAAFGRHPFLSLPSFNFTSPAELLLYAVLGVLATVVGLTFVKVLYAGEDLSDRLWDGRPDWLRPAVGGLALGLLLLAVPEMYGVGYPVLERAVGGHYVVLALVGLLVAKILATSLTMWIGGSGGVFAPSLFMGAMLGIGVRRGRPPAGAQPGLVPGRLRSRRHGSGIRGSCARSDHRRDHHLRAHGRLPDHPAADVRDRGRDCPEQRGTHDTIYTLKLRRRGIDIGKPTPPSLMAQIQVAEAMGIPLDALAPEDPLAGLVARFSSEQSDTLPVVDPEGVLLGVVDASEVEQAIAAGDRDLTAAAVMRSAPEVHGHDTLDEVVPLLVGRDEDGLPVLAPDSDRVDRLADAPRAPGRLPCASQRQSPGPPGDLAVGRRSGAEQAAPRHDGPGGSSRRPGHRCDTRAWAARTPCGYDE